MIVLTDITELERERQRVRRQESQLDNFEDAITHELRNTINVVQGNIELVAADLEPDDAETETRIRTASDAIERMGIIVSDLLTLTRLGRQAEEIETVDIEAAIRRAFSAVADARRSPQLDDRHRPRVRRRRQVRDRLLIPSTALTRRASTPGASGPFTSAYPPA
jgi:light-regulated signal transduction histidine kinase (bacteriophytochrome)